MNKIQYQRLLGLYCPQPITSKKEYARIFNCLEKLQKSKLPAEKLLAKLLVILLQDYEAHLDQHEESSGTEVLRFLMEARGHKPKDLHYVIDKGELSRILNDSRRISRSVAKKLGEIYAVSPKTFIDI